jgi:hypothetical protein
MQKGIMQCQLELYDGRDYVEGQHIYPAAHDVPNNIPGGIRLYPKRINMSARYTVSCIKNCRPKHNERRGCALNSTSYVMETEK